MVQHSVYAELAGIPVALLGLLVYVTVMGLLLVAQNDNTRTALLSIIAVGFGFSMYLTYRELFTLHEICEWCVGSATFLTLLTGLSIARFLRGGDPETPPATQAGSPAMPDGGHAAPLPG